MLNRGWIPAGMLEPGDQLLSHDGQRFTVDGVADSGKVYTVYNVRVADWHTYFVGSEGWGFSVWAHNEYGSKQARDTFRKRIERSGVEGDVKNWLLQIGDPTGVSGGNWAQGWTGARLKALASKSPQEAIATIQAEAKAAGINISHLEQNGLASHGNSLTAAGPHDVYVVRDADTGELLHFGETGRGFRERFEVHLRTTFKDSERSLDVELLRTVEGKEAAKAIETRYITTYTRIFGKRPAFNPVDH